jgi:hypothetical protein
MYGHMEHPRPHMHVKFAEYEVSVALDDLSIIKGRLPRAQQQAAMQWIAEHQAELLEMWKHPLEPGGIHPLP